MKKMLYQSSLLLVPVLTGSEGGWTVITKRAHGLNWTLMGPKPDPFHTTKQKPHMEGISSISPERGPEAQ